MPQPLNFVIDLHTHTFCSDGVLGPMELIRRAQVNGYKVIGLADHVDPATVGRTLETALIAARSFNKVEAEVKVLPGVELTHVPPALISDMIKTARDLGAAYVVVHGETITEPVWPGTNLAAIKGGADILAHPGHLTEEEAALAAEKGVFLEISARGGHGLCNGLVARLAQKHGAALMINSDAHAPGDLLTPQHQLSVALGAGLSYEDYSSILAKADAFTAQRLTAVY